MAFSLYQSLRTVPARAARGGAVFQLSGWQRFWRLELPFAMPGLLWNMMMSMSGGWFFVVASEAISVSNQSIKLPGVGSYIAMAIEARDLGAIGWAIGGMLVGILLYDQLFFRPLIAWADKFRFEEGGGEDAPRSWLLTWLRRTDRLQRIGLRSCGCSNARWLLFRRDHDGTSIKARPRAATRRRSRVWDATLAAAVLLAAAWLVRFIHTEVGWTEVGARVRAGLLHAGAGAGADRAGGAGVGAGRHLDRHESALGRAAAGRGAVPGRVSGQPDVPGGGALHRALAARTRTSGWRR